MTACFFQLGSTFINGAGNDSSKPAKAKTQRWKKSDRNCHPSFRRSAAFRQASGYLCGSMPPTPRHPEVSLRRVVEIVVIIHVRVCRVGFRNENAEVNAPVFCFFASDRTSAPIAVPRGVSASPRRCSRCRRWAICDSRKKRIALLIASSETPMPALRAANNPLGAWRYSPSERRGHDRERRRSMSRCSPRAMQASAFRRSDQQKRSAFSRIAIAQRRHRLHRRGLAERRAHGDWARSSVAREKTENRRVHFRVFVSKIPTRQTRTCIITTISTTRRRLTSGCRRRGRHEPHKYPDACRNAAERRKLGMAVSVRLFHRCVFAFAGFDYRFLPIYER